MLSRMDHVTILLSEEDFNFPPRWLTDNFTIIDGGKHTGQPSRLKLIVFADGSYLELFNWYDEPPKGHSWGWRIPGLLDWGISCTSKEPASEHFQGVLSRLADGHKPDASACQIGVTFPEPSNQGRTTPSGRSLHWTRANPIFFQAPKTPGEQFFPNGRLDAPFLCYDGTPRRERLHFDDPARTTHSCGATGISGLEILVPASHEAEYISLISRILGQEPSETRQDGGVAFDIGVPVSTGPHDKCTVWIHGDRGIDEREQLLSKGIGMITLSLRAEKERAHIGSGSTAANISLVNK